jgi:hypothetical protein
MALLPGPGCSPVLGSRLNVDFEINMIWTMHVLLVMCADSEALTQELPTTQVALRHQVREVQAGLFCKIGLFCLCVIVLIIFI